MCAFGWKNTDYTDFLPRINADLFFYHEGIRLRWAMPASPDRLRHEKGLIFSQKNAQNAQKDVKNDQKSAL